MSFYFLLTSFVLGFLTSSVSICVQRDYSTRIITVFMLLGIIYIAGVHIYGISNYITQSVVIASFYMNFSMSFGYRLSSIIAYLLCIFSPVLNERETDVIAILTTVHFVFSVLKIGKKSYLMSNVDIIVNLLTAIVYTLNLHVTEYIEPGIAIMLMGCISLLKGISTLVN